MKNFVIFSGFLLLFSIQMTAQEKWAVELRPQVNFPTQQPDVMDLKIGYGFEALLLYNFTESLGVYAGWGWNNFGVDEENEFADLEIDETGYSFGLNYVRPISNSMSYLIGIGGIYKHFEFEDNSGDIKADSGHELGFEVKGGLVFELGNNFDLKPQVVYRSLSATGDFGAVDADLELQYISFGLGIAKRF